MTNNEVTASVGTRFNLLDLSDKKEILVLFAQEIRKNNINEQMTTGNRLSKIIERFRDSVISGFFGQGNEESFPKGMTYSENVGGAAFNRRIKTNDTVGAKTLFSVDFNENLSLGADIALQQSNHPANTIPNTALQNGIPFTKIDGDIPANRIAGRISDSNLGITSNLLKKWTQLMGFPVLLTPFDETPSHSNIAFENFELSESYRNFNFIHIKMDFFSFTQQLGYFSKTYPTEDFFSSRFQRFFADSDGNLLSCYMLNDIQLRVRRQSIRAGLVGVWGIGRIAGDLTQDELDILS